MDKTPLFNIRKIIQRGNVDYLRDNKYKIDENNGDIVFENGMTSNLNVFTDEYISYEDFIKALGFKLNIGCLHLDTFNKDLTKNISSDCGDYSVQKVEHFIVLLKNVKVGTFSSEIEAKNYIEVQKKNILIHEIIMETGLSFKTVSKILDAEEKIKNRS